MVYMRGQVVCGEGGLQRDRETHPNFTPHHPVSTSGRHGRGRGHGRHRPARRDDVAPHRARERGWRYRTTKAMPRKRWRRRGRRAASSHFSSPSKRTPTRLQDHRHDGPDGRVTVRVRATGRGVRSNRRTPQSVVPEKKKQDHAQQGSRAWTRQKQRWSVGCHVREGGCHIRKGLWEYVSGTDRARVGWKRRRSAPKSYTPSVFRTVPGHELVEEPAGTPPREAAGRVGGRVAPAAPWARPTSKRKPPGPLGGEAAPGLGFSLQDLERIPPRLLNERHRSIHFEDFGCLSF